MGARERATERADSRSRVRAVRPPAWAVAALAVLVIAIAVLAFWRPWAQPAASIAAGAEEVVAVTPPELLDLPENPRVLIFGDSWTWGEAAAPGEGYAYVVADIAGWTTVVDGIQGSGYLREGKNGLTFGQRIDRLDPAPNPELDPDLVIVQGSINDRKLYPEGYRDAVVAAWDALAELYPSARIVILGPAPHILPVEESTIAVDAELSRLAAARSWWYISPLAEEWITDADYLDVIDTSEVGRNHPSTAGHRYLAERLAAAVEAISR
ncbi:SGNH/GDSL hydrolase family protein [Microbacterium sp. T2.11-28]|uniref:SGNH/GDSL hydrolase family protein n=1 Tax=Microbacterium sp. T2.11-28 TaxID=3041169 RepID=UPI00247773B8|nr:SGNH/GDSL hydrolase family protein [Microbacterium sp. T2.11-28]CAI9387775.1 hypothetical protein MICABA_02844 [Microbacterium sp. T2.11-28]